MKLIRLLLQNSWVIVIFAAISGLLSGVSSAGLIALINFTLKNFALPKAPLAWGFVGLCCLLLVSSATSLILVSRLAQQIVFNLQIGLTRRILSCPLHQLETVGSPRLLAALTEDIDAIATASFAVSGLCVNVALLGGCLIYLGWLSISVFFFFIAFLFLGIFSYQFLVKRGRRDLKLAREIQDRLFQHFKTTTEGTKELKLHRSKRMAFLTQDLQLSAQLFREHRVNGMTIFAIASGWGLVLFFIPIGLLIFALPQITTLSVPILSGYALTIIFMITPLRGILNTLPELAKADIALDKIESLGLSLAAQGTEQELTTSLLELNPNWSSLKLVGVTHAYPVEREDSKFIVGPIDLSFRPGEIVFIVGGNGSGKSTLVKLITGLYVPETGEIQVDGQVITDDNREWYRQHFSVVFADFYLFDRLLGLDIDHLERQSQEYLEKLQLDHKVQVREGVLSTTALSQGQRKRLALLTAYLENRPIYVFDEWASDQDPMFKEIFYKQLLSELKSRGKTVLVVSHDDRYFHLADTIVKLDYGQLVS